MLNKFIFLLAVLAIHQTTGELDNDLNLAEDDNNSNNLNFEHFGGET